MPDAGLELRVRVATVGARHADEEESGSAETMEIIKELEREAKVPVFSDAMRTEKRRDIIKRRGNNERTRAFITKLRNETNSKLSDEEIVGAFILLKPLRQYVKREKMAVINKRDPKFPEKIREMVENLVKRVVDKKVVLDLKEGETVTFTLAHLNLPKEKLVELWLRYMNLSPSLPFISGLHSQGSMITSNGSCEIGHIFSNSSAATRGGGVPIPWSAHGSRSWEQKVTCEPFTYRENKLQANVHMEFHSKLEYTKSESYNPKERTDPKRKQGPENQPEREAKTPKEGREKDYSRTVAKMTSNPMSDYTGRPEVKLTIPKMSFGIETTCNNCSSQDQTCERTCGRYFINKVAIEVRPTGWAQSGPELEPCHSPQIFEIQNNRNFGVQIIAAVGLQHLLQVNGNVQVGRTVKRLGPADAWGASRDFFGNNPLSGNWHWELLRFADGNKFQFEKANPRSETPLGFKPTYITMQPPVSASWDANPSAASRKLPLAWDMTLTVETALFKGTRGIEVHRGPFITYEGQLTFV